ncbi:MAG: Acyl-homoserine-lactone acylase [Chloroflexi bacterium]|nr:Acyl-homoserine-lactone acylase [Chloroflexota bacterium]
MSPALKKILLGLLVFILVVGIVAAGFGVYTVRNSFPQVKGEIQIAGLDGPVDIYRDEFGVPHIFATTQHDLFFAQGYVHAQDRFWQMDFWRHIGSGRLSEMFGESQLETDRFLRTLGWARLAQEEVKTTDPETLKTLQDYAAGVNAYLGEHTGSDLSLEYAVLKLLNSGYQPEPWQPLHTTTWAKVMAWDLGGNMNREIQLAVLSKTFTQAQLDELFPPYPSDHPYIVPGFTLGSQPQNDRSVSQPIPDLTGLFQRVARQAALLDPVLGPRTAEIGSNNWVVSGDLTASGKPLLANDPHLGIQMPSIWYEVGLHCVNKGPDCPYDVTGFSFAGAPGVIIGHNDRIAWGLTNVGPDVQDLFIEKINPDNPNQYEVNGQWVDMQLVKETIQVAGGEPQELTVRYTRHGPIVSDTYADLEDFGQKAGGDIPENYAVALRWTALEVNHMFRAVIGFDRAQNWDEFREAARSFTVPSQNLVYADVDGNIGYQTPGNIPIRAQGDGRLPVPGWTDEYEWQGYIPFEELPNTFNPPQGYVATANNAVVDSSYPYFINYYWDYGFRAKRIVELIEVGAGSIDIPYMQSIQGDAKDLNAELLVPILLQIPLDDERLSDARAILQDWDYFNTLDSAPGALYNLFWKNLLVETLHDDLPEDYWPGGGTLAFEFFRQQVDQPDSYWWDNQGTPEVENRDQIFSRAFAKAVDEIEQLQGKDSKRWNWGDLHTATFENQTLGQSGVGPIEALFNRGPFQTPGSSSNVNNIGWDAVDGFNVNSLPSMRMVVDLGNLENSQTMHTTGQSGHAYHPHYIDMADYWRATQYHPMLWSRAQVESGADNYLRLVP